MVEGFIDMDAIVSDSGWNLFPHQNKHTFGTRGVSVDLNILEEYLGEGGLTLANMTDFATFITGDFDGYRIERLYASELDDVNEDGYNDNLLFTKDINGNYSVEITFGNDLGSFVPTEEVPIGGTVVTLLDDGNDWFGGIDSCRVSFPELEF